MGKKRTSSSQKTSSETKSPKQAVLFKKWTQAELSTNTLRVFREKLNQLVYDLCLVAATDACPPPIIHRIRVTTRRLQSLLELTYGKPTAKIPKAFRRALKAIRDSAGSLRELDVLHEDWQSSSTSPKDINHFAEQRGHQSKQLREIIRKLLFKKRLIDLFEEFSIDLESLLVDPKRLSSDWLNLSLQKVALSLLDRIPSDLDNSQAWHRLRIGCKSLRYAIEIASDVYQSPQRTELLTFVRNLQQSLGELNDLATHVQKMKEWGNRPNRRKSSSPLDSFLAHQESLLHQQLKTIAQWWTAEGESQLRSLIG